MSGQIFKNAIQCTDRVSGSVGCFIYPEDKPFEAHSPVFDGLVELYDWLKSNGYKQSNIGLLAEYRKVK